MSKSKVQKVLSSPTKLMRETMVTPNGFLAHLWRRVLFDLRMSPAKWDELVTVYLEETEGIARHSNTKEDNYQRGKVRNALNTELFQDAITLNTFMRGLQVLKFDTASFTVKATRYNREIDSMVEVALNFDQLNALMSHQGKMTEPKSKNKKEVKDESK